MPKRSLVTILQNLTGLQWDAIFSRPRWSSNFSIILKDWIVFAPQNSLVFFNLKWIPYYEKNVRSKRVSFSRHWRYTGKVKNLFYLVAIEFRQLLNLRQKLTEVWTPTANCMLGCLRRIHFRQISGFYYWYYFDNKLPQSKYYSLGLPTFRSMILFHRPQTLTHKFLRLIYLLTTHEFW